MKEKLLEILSNIKEDARFFVQDYSEYETTHTVPHSFEQKPFVENLIQTNINISMHPEREDEIVVGNYRLHLKNFIENIYYETPNVENFMEHVSKYNPYFKVFIKIDDEAKTITFKLGDKEKTLTLLEEGFNGYVSKIFKKNYMKCNSIKDLKEHILDEFWNPRMVMVGRVALQMDKITF